MPKLEDLVPPNIIVDLINERARQERLRESGKFIYTLAHPAASAETMDVLTEELGEVARARLEKDPSQERKELIELAACCISRVCALDEPKWLEPSVINDLAVGKLKLSDFSAIQTLIDSSAVATSSLSG